MKTEVGPKHRTPRKVKLTAGLSIGILVSCLAWAGCSVEKYHDTLSIFFDGVPNPEARAKAEASGKIAVDIRKSKTYTIHKPFADESCTACHSERAELAGQDSSVCLKCHSDRVTEHPKMHGPVAAVACLWCHSPHESAEAHLLKKPARQVCLQCHEQSLLSTDRVPEHADASRSCLDCHYGHGGNSTFFLRAGVSRAPPVQPVSEPAQK